MAKTFRPYVPEQDFLLPPSLREWLPSDHLAYFVSDLVDQLDLAAIVAPYEREERGFPPYHPVMLTKVLLYAYCVGVFSSRKIQRRLTEDVAFRVLAAENQPDFRTIADFRQRHLAALEGLFVQVLRLAREAGALRVGRVAIDGSKLRANASKHKAMSYKRMVEKEQQLTQEVHHLLTQATATDEQEDTQYGRDRRGDDLPEELRRRETRLARIREAKRVLEARADEQAEAKGQDPERAAPEDKAQYNFTDPESRIMKGPDGFVQAYNAQIAVEPTCQLIVGQAVTQAVNDKQQLAPMVETIASQSDAVPDEVLADSGYCSDANLVYLAARHIDGYVATGRVKHDAPAPPCRGPLPPHATLTDRMRRKLQTKRGAAVYRWRKAIVEPVFGQMKHGRGFRQFLLRGLEKVRGEWSLLCLTHNILKCYGLIYR
ncbi:MAG: IS1182 family transposase [Acidobacteria bacterium]|nr:MAG: IS1182 family transposase [Acidobacteriota bacterium]